MATATHPQPTFRKVIDLDAAEQERLSEFAKKESVDEGEIIHRSLRSYQSNAFTINVNEAEYQSVLAELNMVLDRAIEQVQASQKDVAETNKLIRALRETKQ